ncbi:hypothetical protein CEP53_006378 [Fusarium sp. AF-6]|nr:hypothetical protein CEP53_006378 [Fusarium sp. AF-6]
MPPDFSSTLIVTRERHEPCFPRNVKWDLNQLPTNGLKTTAIELISFWIFSAAYEAERTDYALLARWTKQLRRRDVAPRRESTLNLAAELARSDGSNATRAGQAADDASPLAACVTATASGEKDPP